MIEDVSQNTIESELFGIQRLKSRIIEQISHEFRSPLTSIIGFASVLEESKHIDEQQRMEYARYIRNEGQRLAKIVSDLMDLDALEQGRATFLFEKHEIHEIVHRTASLLEEYAGNKSITISQELPDDPMIVSCDAERITNALYQFLHNAIRFSKSGGLVILKAETTDPFFVKISIQDNGLGIPARDLPFLFNHFGKLFHPDKETHGTGIGLVLAKYIIDRHSGSITVQSRVGVGSTFTIRIPIQL
jgi:signal transduction histidine kinase